MPPMSEIREVFCAAADATAVLLDEPALLQGFDGPSALEEFSVRGLAGHLLRAMTSVEGYLDAAEPEAELGRVEAVSAAGYYAAVLGDATVDIQDDLNRAVRQRGLESAPGAPEGFTAVWAETADRLRGRLAAEPSGRLVQVFGGLVLDLDDYLVTRLVELVVHGDDLAVSLGVAPPHLDRAATTLVIDTLVEVARRRHGDAAVLASLTRARARRCRSAAGPLRPDADRSLPGHRCPTTPAVDDYRRLHDARARRRMESGGEGPGFFVREGRPRPRSAPGIGAAGPVRSARRDPTRGPG